MAFLESPAFPGCPSFGFVSQPDYSTVIVRFAGGRETRQRNWARPLYRFTVTVGPRMEKEIEDLLDFWHAVGGQADGFRFRDHADWRSARIASAITPLDQPLVEVAGAPGTYQLIKRYAAGARTQDRDIVKPVAGSVVVANESGVEQSSGTWSLDAVTGIVTPGVGFTGIPATWGGEFDVPVRFDSEFPIELTNLRVQSVSFALMELRL